MNFQPLLKALLGAGYDPSMLRGAGAYASGVPRAGSISIDDLLERALSVSKQNAMSRRLRAAGAMPEETVEKLHPMFLESPGVPRKFFHGTPWNNIETRDLDPKFVGTITDPGFYGEGTTFTLAPGEASSFAEKRTFKNDKIIPRESGAVLQAYLDVQKPFISKPGLRFYESLAEEGMPGFKPMERQRELTEALMDRGYDAALPDPLIPGDYYENLNKWRNQSWAGDRATRIPPPGDEVNVFDKSWIHLPYVAPRIKQLPEIPPGILAALFG